MQGVRDAQQRAGIKPYNHARSNALAVKEASQLNALRKQAAVEQDRLSGEAAVALFCRIRLDTICMSVLYVHGVKRPGGSRTAHAGHCILNPCAVPLAVHTAGGKPSFARSTSAPARRPSGPGILPPAPGAAVPPGGRNFLKENRVGAGVPARPPRPEKVRGCRLALGVEEPNRTQEPACTCAACRQPPFAAHVVQCLLCCSLSQPVRNWLVRWTNAPASNTSHRRMTQPSTCRSGTMGVCPPTSLSARWSWQRQLRQQSVPRRQRSYLQVCVWEQEHTPAMASAG